MKDETPNERRERHERHQAMLEEHKRLKVEARERHRKGWHKYKVIPILAK